MVAKNLVKNQDKPATEIGALNSHSFWLPDILIWQNLLGGATELLNLTPDPQSRDFCDCYHQHLPFWKAETKTSCSWRSLPTWCLHAHTAGRQSPLDPVTCEFTSTALKACPAAGSTTGYSCVGIRDSFIEWGVTAYFLIWINHVHKFFALTFSPDWLKDQDHRMAVTK